MGAQRERPLLGATVLPGVASLWGVLVPALRTWAERLAEIDRMAEICSLGGPCDQT